MSEIIVPNTQQELQLKKLELSALLEITQAINENLPESALYKIYHFTLLAQLQINRLVLFVHDEDWQCKICYGTEMDFMKCEMPEEIVNLQEITFIAGLQVDKRWRGFEIVIPILHNGRVLAFVMIGKIQPYYNNLEALNFLQTVSNIMLVAIENHRMNRQRLAQESIRREIEIAREVQSMLFPKSLPNDKDVTIHASYIPHSSIGGDYYDFIDIDQDQFLFCVADVSGKGVPASLLMSNFQAGLRTILRQVADLNTVVSELNNLIYRNAIAEKFITAFLAIYNRKTRELSYVNAGHNSPILLLEDNSHRLLNEGCTMLGVFDVLPFMSVTTIQVPRRSVLFCYTDGLTEVFDASEAEFGVEGTINYMQKHRFLSSRLLHLQLLKEIHLYNEEAKFDDDITLLSCRFK
ncbi:PP2C family protein-serine/threonine phosphatase [Pontibacter qinzhouensis]|uniref:PP2C family protein-serine/threonine phosphatase n=1 Tax=Pontibacter qinzhouensis TaxID=2603253 RepID=A0A5C8ING9_9BACT|nr:PP2C family protein-serine/threonine phosphatase [Pontibacter qinzhouensis]TXK23263.1 PP2C family protein-serine/threonine phosphatase [Pontibacter qinzhouensis]